jgi:uncharacterized SAM-binding protein YcdF (DUF218 family)
MPQGAPTGVGPPPPAPAAPRVAVTPATTAAPAHPRRRRARLALVLLPPLLLLAGFGLFLAAALDVAPPPPGDTEGIVVLTGGSERIATAFRLLEEGRARRMLISGAHPEAGLAEIAAAAGVDPARFADRVTVGHAAASTRGNAAEAAAWARADPLRSLRVVTAGYHMPRAMLELRRALPEAVLVAHPVPSVTLRAPGALWRPRVWLLLGGEYGRYLVARLGLSGAIAARREGSGP